MDIFEKNYIRWYFHAQKKKIMFLTVLLLASLPLFALLTPEVVHPNYYTTPFVIETSIYTVFLFLLVLFVPLYNFHFLMNRGSVDTYFAMPVKRRRFFSLQFCVGLAGILLLCNAAYFLAIVCEPRAWELCSEFLVLMLILSTVAICLYTLYTFLIIRCNNLWDAIVVCIGYTIIPIIVYASARSMVENALSSFLVSNIADVQEVLPFTSLSNFLSLPFLGVNSFSSFFEALYDTHNELVYVEDTLFRVSNLVPLGFWMMLSIVLYFRAAHAYTIRRGEASGQRTTAKVCYPVLIILSTASLLMNNGISFLSFSALMNILFIFALYLIMVFFARRKIAITKSNLFLFIGLVAGVMMISFIFTSTRGFNRIQELPPLDNVKEVVMYAYLDSDEFMVEGTSIHNFQSDSIKDKDMIADIHSLQGYLVENVIKKDNFYSGDISINLEYRLENGRSFNREYRFLLENEELKREVIRVIKDMISRGYIKLP